MNVGPIVVWASASWRNPTEALDINEALSDAHDAPFLSVNVDRNRSLEIASAIVADRPRATRRLGSAVRVQRPIINPQPDRQRQIAQPIGEAPDRPRRQCDGPHMVSPWPYTQSF